MTHIAINQHIVELARVNIHRAGRGAEGDCLEDCEIRVAEALATALHREGLMETGYYEVALVNNNVVIDSQDLVV